MPERIARWRRTARTRRRLSELNTVMNMGLFIIVLTLYGNIDFGEENVQQIIALVGKNYELLDKSYDACYNYVEHGPS